MTAPDLPQMAPETVQALLLMSRLAAQLRNRQATITNQLNYYRGQHRLVYASPEFADYFGERFAGFSDNWCAPVVDAPAERMNVLGIRLGKESKVDAELGRVWRANDAERGSSEAIVVALAATRSYAMVWGNPKDDDTPRITWERPDQVIISYDPDTGEAVAALKLWADEDQGKEFATLYTDRWLWKFERRGTLSAYVSEPRPAVQPGGGWTPREATGDDTWPVPNPLGELPLVELRNRTLLDDVPLSDIAGVMAVQDTINLVWAYLVNGLDFASLPQRIVTGADVPKIPILNEQGQVVGHRPVELDMLIRERILWVPGANAKTSEWTPANLAVFSEVIERAIEHIAAQTRTPPHYLIGKIANVSAEALAGAETGLVSKAGERITYTTPAIRSINRKVALAMDDQRRAKAALSGTVMWRDPQFRAMGQKVDALLKLKQLGMPLRWICEQYGLEPAEVERVLTMKAEEAAADPLGVITAELGRGGFPPVPPNGDEDQDQGDDPDVDPDQP